MNFCVVHNGRGNTLQCVKNVHFDSNNSDSVPAWLKESFLVSGLPLSHKRKGRMETSMLNT